MGCIFKEYINQSNTYICKCNIKITPGDFTGQYKGEIKERSLPENFKDLTSIGQI